MCYLMIFFYKYFNGKGVYSEISMNGIKTNNKKNKIKGGSDLKSVRYRTPPNLSRPLSPLIIRLSWHMMYLSLHKSLNIPKLFFIHFFILEIFYFLFAPLVARTHVVSSSNLFLFFLHCFLFIYIYFLCCRKSRCVQFGI